ncbi:MAG: hypothetical protein AB7R77_12795 [Ilumatobacteraceae bacterium]
MSTPHEHFTIKTRTGMPLEARLIDIRRRVLATVESFENPIDDPIALIEELPVGPQSTPSSVYALGLVHSAVRVGLYEAGVPVVMVMPSALKRFATGKGNAKKSALGLELYKRTGLELGDDNQVDAYWLRAMGAHGLGEPFFDLPATHTSSDGWKAFLAALGTAQKAYAERPSTRISPELLAKLDSDGSADYHP